MAGWLFPRSGIAPDTVAVKPVDRLSPAVLTRTREYAGKPRASADSNVQVQAGPDGQQSLATITDSVCMGCCKAVSAQFPQQLCPAPADTPLRVVKKHTSRIRVPSLLGLRYRSIRFSLTSHEKIELIIQSVKLKVRKKITICYNDYKLCNDPNPKRVVGATVWQSKGGWNRS